MTIRRATKLASPGRAAICHFAWTRQHSVVVDDVHFEGHSAGGSEHWSKTPCKPRLELKGAANAAVLCKTLAHRASNDLMPSQQREGLDGTLELTCCIQATSPMLRFFASLQQAPYRCTSELGELRCTASACAKLPGLGTWSLYSWQSHGLPKLARRLRAVSPKLGRPPRFANWARSPTPNCAALQLAHRQQLQAPYIDQLPCILLQDRADGKYMQWGEPVSKSRRPWIRCLEAPLRPAP